MYMCEEVVSTSDVYRQGTAAYERTDRVTEVGKEIRRGTGDEVEERREKRVEGEGNSN